MNLYNVHGYNYNKLYFCLGTVTIYIPKISVLAKTLGGVCTFNENYARYCPPSFKWLIYIFVTLPLVYYRVSSFLLEFLPLNFI